MNIRASLATAATAFLLLGTPVVNAGMINWVSATNALNLLDVRNDGVLVEAFNATSSNAGTVTVNGVAFSNTSALLSQGGYTGALATGSSGNAGYDNLLNTFDYGDGSGVVSRAIGAASLVAGNRYIVQVWFNDQRLSGRTMRFGDGEGNTVDVNAGGAGLGQFAVGSFQYSGSSPGDQAFTLDALGFRNAHINAYQLRDVTVPPGATTAKVPEPTSLLLLGLGLIAATARQCRRGLSVG